MAKSPRPGEGDIEVTIDGDLQVLRPTFQAARAISTKYGGTMRAAERVLNGDIEVIVDILALGLGYIGNRRPPPDFAEKVWRTGITDRTGRLADLSVQYLQTLASGGRPPDDGPQEGEASQDTSDPQ